MAKSLKYSPDVFLNSVLASAEDAVDIAAKIKGDKPFPGLDGAWYPVS